MAFYKSIFNFFFFREGGGVGGNSFEKVKLLPRLLKKKRNIYLLMTSILYPNEVGLNVYEMLFL